MNLKNIFRTTVPFIKHSDRRTSKAVRIECWDDARVVNKFKKKCEQENVTVSDVIRSFMREAVKV